MSFVLPKSFACLLIISGAACAEMAAGSLSVRNEPSVFPLLGTTTVVVNGTGVPASSEIEFSVSQGSTHVTNAAVVESKLVVANDGDGDGIYEEYSKEFVLDLSGLDPAVPCRRTANAAMNGKSVVAYGSITLVPPVVVSADNTGYVPTLHGNSLSFYLRVQGGPEAARTHTVLRNATVVTSTVSVTETSLWEESRDGVIVDRLIRIDVGLGDLALAIGDEIEFASSVDLGVGTWTTSDVVRLEDPAKHADLIACVERCVGEFVEAAEVSKARDGRVSVSASSAAVATAAKALATQMKSCGWTSGKRKVTANGLSVVVGFGAVTASVDLVIACGTDGLLPGEPGGNSNAVNAQPGGAAIADGGEAGAGAEGRGGSAFSMTMGGDSVATGGGGSAGASGGGDGGTANAKSQVSGGSAKALGGPGGDPHSSGVAGGKGGAATAKDGKGVGGDAPGGEGGKNDTGVGQHGLGGVATAKNGVGKQTTGDTLPNSD